MRIVGSYFLFLFLWLIAVDAFAQETQLKYLSGKGSDDAVDWQFYCTGGMNSGKWTTIPVPSCWELQGFGKYDYGFAKDSIRGKEKGLYKYSFLVPSAWKNKKVQIVFEGSMTDTEVKINGKVAGPVHQGAFYAFRYDITPLVKVGASNLLEVTVAKHSANESINAAERRADFWIFGGIFRPVYLEALPQQYLKEVAVDATASGAFTAKVWVEGNPEKVSVRLYNPDGSAFGNAVSAWVKDNSAVLKNNYASPALWSPEFPNLYKAVFTLYSKGKILHTVSKKIGFRTIEVKERDGLYVNGVKVKMKGVNRHSFWPNSGRTTSKRISIADVLLMKDMNMNAVRMSHYPPDDHFLDACDSLGLFVMDELAGWHGHYDTETGAKLLREMIEHDVNHPSVIFWANGNEGGHNLELDPLFGMYDIQHRPLVHPWQLFGGFDTQHYREYNYGIGNYENGREIVMPTEFLHGQFDGGHGAGLEDYWEKMWHNPLSAGGFLWDFADQGVVRKDKGDSLDTDKHRGADGIVGPYRQKEGSYFAIKEIWSPIYFERREITPGFDGVLRIENRYHFTNTKQCSFSFTLKKWFGGKRKEQTGPVAAPDLRPMERGVLQLNLPKGWNEYDCLYVTAFGPDKKEIFTWSFPIVNPETVSHTILQASVASSKKMEWALQDSVYVVRANGILYYIDQRNGLLQEVSNEKGVIPFRNGPVLQEGINNFQNFRHRLKGDTLIIESAFDRKKSYNTLQWTIYPNGLLRMQVNYFPAAYFTSMDGVNFSFPETQVKGVRYMGDGPYRVWKNRMKGTRFGVWEKAYNNTETGEAPWLYPEFKGYYSRMYWCSFTTTGQPFTVFTPNEDLFLRLFTPAWKTDQWHNYEPLFPSGDISFMQGISSIGTKTQRAETTGPMGQKNIYYDYEKDPSRYRKIILYFDFSGKGIGSATKE